MRYPSYNKYSNRKLKTPDGTFDSQREYNRWCELKILERAGEINALQRQVKFVLIPTQREEITNKVIEKECSYIADFVYIDRKTLDTVVEDTKGYKTPEYIIKRKLMLQVYDIRIREIQYI